MHYYKFNIGDYRKDTGHLSTVEHGIYRQLIDWYYLDEKPIPKETQVVMRRLRLGSDEIHLLQNVLQDFFNLTENGYVHSRVEIELNEYQAQFAKNRVNGKAGGRPSKTQVVSDGLAKITQVDAKHNPNHKPLTINHKPIRNIKGSRLSNDWILPTEWIDAAKVINGSLTTDQVKSIAEVFKDYWISLTGARAVKGDWLATWRNWIRRQDTPTAKKEDDARAKLKAELL